MRRFTGYGELRAFLKGSSRRKSRAIGTPRGDLPRDRTFRPLHQGGLPELSSQGSQGTRHRRHRVMDPPEPRASRGRTYADICACGARPLVPERCLSDPRTLDRAADDSAREELRRCESSRPCLGARLFRLSARFSSTRDSAGAGARPTSRRRHHSSPLLRRTGTVDVRRPRAALTHEGSPARSERIREDFPFDLIHAHFIYPEGVVAARLAERYGVPFVVTEHAPWTGWLEQRGIGRQAVPAARAASAVMPVSSSVLRTSAPSPGSRFTQPSSPWGWTTMSSVQETSQHENPTRSSMSG